MYPNNANIEIYISAASASASSSSLSALDPSYGSASALNSDLERQLGNDLDYFSYPQTTSGSYHVEEPIDIQTRCYPRPSTPMPPDSSSDLLNVTRGQAQAQAQTQAQVYDLISRVNGGDHYPSSQYAQHEYPQDVTVGPAMHMPLTLTPIPDPSMIHIQTPSRLPTPGLRRPRLIGPRPPHPPRAQNRYSVGMELLQEGYCAKRETRWRKVQRWVGDV